MGKGKRNKAARAAERAIAPVQPSRAAPEEELSAAVMVVGELFGIEPACASAAGLLSEVGAQLGYELRPRPVAVLIHDQPTNTILSMGPKVRARLSQEQLGRMENHRPQGQDNGHLVLTSEEPRMVLDPNMRQLGTYGVDAPSIIIRVKSTQPESDEWHFSADGLSLLYILDEENAVLLPLFNETRRDSTVRVAARTIADGIRSGLDPDAIVRSVRMRAPSML